MGRKQCCPRSQHCSLQCWEAQEGSLCLPAHQEIVIQTLPLNSKNSWLHGTAAEMISAVPVRTINRIAQLYIKQISWTHSIYFMQFITELPETIPVSWKVWHVDELFVHLFGCDKQIRKWIFPSGKLLSSCCLQFIHERWTRVRILHLCDLEPDRALWCELTDCAEMKTLFIQVHILKWYCRDFITMKYLKKSFPQGTADINVYIKQQCFGS